MKKILETKRLILRQLEIKDADFMLELVNTPEWLHYIGDKDVKSIDDAQNYIVNGPFKSYKENGFGLWLIELKDSTRIGICGFMKRETLEHVDIGYALMPQFFRKGYGFEIVSATKEYARSDFKIGKVLAIVDYDNEASIGLLSKLGFYFERTVTMPKSKPAQLFSLSIAITETHKSC